MSGSKIRLGLVENRPKFLQKICYTSRIDSYSLPKNYVQKNLSLLSTWNIRKLNHIQPKIVANINLRKQAKEILKGRSIICHLGTSQPKKEWPLRKWQEFYNSLEKQRRNLVVFSSGNSYRERSLLADLKKLEPDIFTLPMIKNLNLYIAVLNEAKLVISGDTAPLHFFSSAWCKCYRFVWYLWFYSICCTYLFK